MVCKGGIQMNQRKKMLFKGLLTVLCFPAIMGGIWPALSQSKLQDSWQELIQSRREAAYFKFYARHDAELKKEPFEYFFRLSR